MELTGLLPVLRRWLVVVLIATGMATLVGWRLAATADETYEASAMVLVGPLNTDNDTMRASSALSQTYAELATTDAVLDDVAETTGVSRAELTDGVRATANGTTRFLTVRARAEDPESAADVANGVAVGLVDLGRQDALRPEGQLRVIDPATPPSSPISPRTDLVVPLAALAGLLGSATLVLVFEFAGDMAETAVKVTEAAEVPTLTVRRRSHLRLREGRRADALDVVATQVELAAPGARCVVVTGASEDDGTVGLALDLARRWADRREGVTVLDGRADLVTVWGDRAAADAPRREAITEAQARATIDAIAGERHLVVVIAPSPVSSTGTLVWARVADVTLLGVRRFQARRAQVRDAAANLRAARATLAFAILHDGGSGPAADEGSGDAPDPEAEPTPVPAPRPGVVRPVREGGVGASAAAPRPGRAQRQPAGPGPGGGGGRVTAVRAPASVPDAAGTDRAPVRVAYVTSRFPRLTETFVVDEVAAVVRAGAAVEVHPLHRERSALVQPDAAALAPLVRHRRLGSPRVLAAAVREAAARPAAVAGAAATVVRQTWGSRRLLVGAVASFPFAVDLARRLRADGVDHVHCHFATHPAAVGWVVHRLTGIPFSFTAHGSDLHRDRHMLATKVRAAAFVVAISEFNRDVILATDGCAGAGDRVRVVHCGIDHRRFRPRTPPARAPGAPLRVCCIGTLHEVKGQAVLIEACRRLVAAGRDVRCTLVGDGPDRSELEAQVAAAGLEGRVTCTGRVVRAEVQRALAEADVLVAPSVPTADGRREGIPVVVLEAMASGVPVVASRLSGIPEVVRDGTTGLLVEPGDAGGVAAALERLARDPDEAARLARAAADLVAADFDLDRSAARLVDLFAGTASS